MAQDRRFVIFELSIHFRSADSIPDPRGCYVGLWFCPRGALPTKLAEKSELVCSLERRTRREHNEGGAREREEDWQMAWRKGLTGVGSAAVAFSGAAYYYRPDPSGELLDSRRTRSPKVRGNFNFLIFSPVVAAGHVSADTRMTMSRTCACRCTRRIPLLPWRPVPLSAQ